MKDRIAEILRGSFDLHVQAGPDPGQELRVDALDAGRYAHEAEMGGFVLKSHHYPTAPLAHALNRVYPGLNVVGAVALNAQVGGLNPEPSRLPPPWAPASSGCRPTTPTSS